MVKQHTGKHLINLGHNNSPVTPKSIDFTNLVIKKLLFFIIDDKI